MGAKSEAGWYTSLEGTRGAPRLVMYHRSVAAVTAVQCCMSGRRFATDLSGVISREIHGPVRGVSRKMMCPCVMCGDHDSVHLSSLANIVSVSLWTKDKQHLELIFWSPSRHPSMKSIKETATTGTSKNFSMENLALLICQKTN